MRVEFEFEKETANTVRYSEITEGEDSPVIGKLYVQKFALLDVTAAADVEGEQWPQKVTLTLEVQ